MADLFVTEISGYGDLKLNRNDIEMARGYESVPYLSLFGDDGDWFGNALLSGTQKFTSLTEKTLRSVPLTSSGLRRIEQAIKEDLKFINQSVPGTVEDIRVSLISDDRIDIGIVIEGEEWFYNWNPRNIDLPKDRVILKWRIHTKEFTPEFD